MRLKPRLEYNKRWSDQFGGSAEGSRYDSRSYRENKKNKLIERFLRKTFFLFHFYSIFQFYLFSFLVFSFLVF